MAFRTWGRLLLTALGVSVLAGAGQLGVAYGFGIVRLTGAFTGTTVNQWPAQLVWVGWFAANAAVAGAVLAGRLARRDAPAAGTGRQLAVGGAAALGATVIAPLCMQPARAAELISVDPVWAVGICAIVGAVIGAGAAIAVLFRPELGWNVAVVAGAVWLLALISVLPSIGTTGPLPTVRLGVLEPSWLDDAAAQRLALLLLPTVALLAGAATAGLARWRGQAALVSGATGVAGPVLVAFAYLTAGPGDAVDRYQATPYYGSLIAILAGALGAAAAALLRWPTGTRTADPQAIEPTAILRPLNTGPALPDAVPASDQVTAERPDTETTNAELATTQPGGVVAGQWATGKPDGVRTVPAHWDWPNTTAGGQHGSTPSASAPGASAPGASAPGASAPGASAPGASAPGASAPGASAPGASTQPAAWLTAPTGEFSAAGQTPPAQRDDVAAPTRPSASTDVSDVTPTSGTAGRADAVPTTGGRATDDPTTSTPTDTTDSAATGTSDSAAPGRSSGGRTTRPSTAVASSTTPGTTGSTAPIATPAGATGTSAAGTSAAGTSAGRGTGATGTAAPSPVTAATGPTRAGTGPAPNGPDATTTGTGTGTDATSAPDLGTPETPPTIKPRRTRKSKANPEAAVPDDLSPVDSATGTGSNTDETVTSEKATGRAPKGTRPGGSAVGANSDAATDTPVPSQGSKGGRSNSTSEVTSTGAAGTAAAQPADSAKPESATPVTGSKRLPATSTVAATGATQMPAKPKSPTAATDSTPTPTAATDSTPTTGTGTETGAGRAPATATGDTRAGGATAPARVPKAGPAASADTTSPASDSAIAESPGSDSARPTADGLSTAGLFEATAASDLDAGRWTPAPSGWPVTSTWTVPPQAAEPGVTATEGSSGSDEPAGTTPRPRHRAPLPDLSRAGTWNAFDTSRRGGSAGSPGTSPAHPAPADASGTTAPTVRPAPPAFPGTADAPSGATTTGKVDTNIDSDTDTDSDSDSGTAITGTGTGDLAPADATSAMPTPPKVTEQSSRRGRLGGLFRRNRSRADEESTKTSDEAEPLASQDEEFVDWVAGLSKPVSDNEPEQENARRSLRSTGRHHRE
ncbi:hypothetical protein [Micromonospora sp. NPDC005710]|uniref:hypothetical protein n=1 Tax=Micromonospora sp. NPDC005710 TaxID=3157051 RepID=UPI003410303D